MSNATKQANKKGVGRPATGITKEVIKASVDKALVAKARKVAKITGENFSHFVSRAIHAAILQKL